MADDRQRFSWLQLEAYAIEHSLLGAGGKIQEPVDGEPPLRLRQQQMRLLMSQVLDRELDATIRRPGLHDIAPALDHHFEGLQRTPGNDAGGNHHAARQTAVDGAISPPPEK